MTCILLVGCSLPSPFAYPRFWDFPTAKPDAGEIAGSYQILDARSPELGKTGALVTDFRSHKIVVLTLNRDHTVVFAGLLQFDPFGQKLTCSYLGTASWRLDGENNGGSWSVDFIDYRAATPHDNAARQCPNENAIWGILILGRHAPYRLWLTVGDPDGDTGIEFKRIHS
jgi:hypothetical protein